LLQILALKESTQQLDHSIYARLPFREEIPFFMDRLFGRHQ